MSSSEWLAVAAGHKQRGEIGKAIDVLEQAVAIGEQSVEICKEIARLCLSVDEVRAFQNWCHEAMRVAPADPEPHLMIARVLVADERWGEAMEALDQTLRLTALEAWQRREAEQLLAKVRDHYRAWKMLHPGTSNLY
ncbi:MAG: hypothetical protein HY235_00670 [Acidobacteria bacterium]|nr:hypothetical protein [Acidobacteriota bacterium]